MRARRYLEPALRAPLHNPTRRLVLCAAAVIALVSTALATRLELRTNVAELLPSRDPAIVELERLGRSLDGTSVLQIAVESPDRAANLRFAEALTARLRALPGDTLASAEYEVRAERAFFSSRKWLYAPLDELERLRDSLRSEVARKKNPLYVELDEPEPPKQILERLKQKSQRIDRFPSGVFENQEGTLVVIVCRPPGGLFAERAGEKLALAARRLADELEPARFQPQLRAGLTGDVVAQLEERAALENDLAWATTVCVVLVALVVVLFYGRVRALLYVGAPAVLGVLVALAVAELAFGYLNASTAFLGSIVLGNGINFPIVQLARYEEERRAGRTVEEALERALQATLRPTGIAAFGAALAYGSLVVTRFRGFQQFGVIGGVGMVTAWLGTVTLLPALVAALDRRASPARPLSWRGPSLVTPLARLATRAPRACVTLLLLLTVGALAPLPRYLRDPFEYDFRNLRNRRSLERGGGAQLAPRVDALFGLTLTPTVVLADRRAHTEEIRTLILDRDKKLPGGPLIAQVTTLEDFLPGTPDEQAGKLAVLAELRRLIDRELVPRADEKERADLDELRPPDALRPVADADLPEAVRRPFTERDGTLGRIVLVYHGENVSVWDGHNLLRIADLVGLLPLSDGTVLRSSGHAVVFAAMIRSIVHDAPLATLASLSAVALLVLIVAGRRAGVPVLAVLAAGVVWMLGAAAALSVKTNFLNFIALPITFGIGVDYGINVYLRARASSDPARAVETTGAAVALCSLTTIIGYGALLVADNQALRSFGEVAILGEVFCLAAALVGLPAWFARHKIRHRARP